MSFIMFFAVKSKKKLSAKAMAGVIFLAARDKCVSGTVDDLDKQISLYVIKSERIADCRNMVKKEISFLLKQAKLDHHISSRMARDYIQGAQFDSKNIYNVYLDICYNYINKFDEDEKNLAREIKIMLGLK